MDQSQTMPPINFMISEKMDVKAWLTYYKNMWTRNQVATMIDIATDIELKAKNPNTMVTSDTDRTLTIPVKVRLEDRKVRMEDNLRLLAAVDSMLAMTTEELTKTYMTEEALKVADDVAKEMQDEIDEYNRKHGITPEKAPEEAPTAEVEKPVEGEVVTQAEANVAPIQEELPAEPAPEKEAETTEGEINKDNQ